jgi:putative mRNA 3-end processing factor
MADLVVAAKEGLLCVPGDFYIDPWLPVERAVITHAHADHARAGHAHYLTAAPGAAVLRSRLGEISLEALPYGKKIIHNGVTISLHPAGHVLGSAQVRLEWHGEVWVVSGDYKLDPDGTCAPFEPVTCDAFITESTFGLPIYRWEAQQKIFDDIRHWWRRNAEEGRAQRAVLLRLRQGATSIERYRQCRRSHHLPRRGQRTQPDISRERCLVTTHSERE